MGDQDRLEAHNEALREQAHHEDQTAAKADEGVRIELKDLDLLRSTAQLATYPLYLLCTREGAKTMLGRIDQGPDGRFVLREVASALPPCLLAYDRVDELMGWIVREVNDALERAGVPGRCPECGNMVRRWRDRDPAEHAEGCPRLARQDAEARDRAARALEAEGLPPGQDAAAPSSATSSFSTSAEEEKEEESYLADVERNERAVLEGRGNEPDDFEWLLGSYKAARAQVLRFIRDERAAGRDVSAFEDLAVQAALEEARAQPAPAPGSREERSIMGSLRDAAGGLIIHALGPDRLSRCALYGFPEDWPPGHFFDLPSRANCNGCRAAMGMPIEERQALLDSAIAAQRKAG